VPVARVEHVCMLKTARFAVLVIAAAFAAAPAHAFDRSVGMYVIPYAPGTTVKVSHDHTDHDPQGRIDMSGKDGNGTYRIVAAAAGTIRFIQDGFKDNRAGMSPCNNNSVWIEHPNGEWTKYSHMTQYSTTQTAGLSVGDTVATGQFLGYENEVGCAHGKHLHFEVAKPANPASPVDSQGFMTGTNYVPRVCGIPNSQFVKQTTYVVPSVKPGLSVYALRATDSQYQKLWEQARDCGYRLEWIDANLRTGAFGFDLRFRPNVPAVAWASHRKLTKAEYDSKRAGYAAQGLRLTHVDRYTSGGAARYAAIWTR
jgi:hypothetical protein